MRPKNITIRAEDVDLMDFTNSALANSQPFAALIWRILMVDRRPSCCECPLETKCMADVEVLAGPAGISVTRPCNLADYINYMSWTEVHGIMKHNEARMQILRQAEEEHRIRLDVGEPLGCS